MSKSATYNGIWRFPLQESYEDCMGTLLIDENGLIRLELNHSDTLGVNLQRIDEYPIIQGWINKDTPVSLGNVSLRGTHNFQKSVFIIDKALLGAQVDSFDEPAFNTCVASFQYLRDWIKPKFINLTYEGENPVIKLDFESKEEIGKISIGNDANAYIWNQVGYNSAMYDYNLFQKTSFNIESNKGVSVNQCLEIVNKFSLFLSIVLYKRQSPDLITFKCTEQPNYSIFLYFKHRTPLEPGFTSLISYKEHKDSIAGLLSKWFTDYEDIAPIVRYLINGVCREDINDVPDYLCIAQGLDGYYRRFLNPSCKASVPFNQEIREIREHFINVQVISKCRFWPEAFQAARNYYTHLLNKQSAEKYRQILSQTNLRLLTDKAIILLTCCVLDYFGFNNSEIDECIKRSQFAHGRINFLEHMQAKEQLGCDEAYALIYDYLETYGNQNHGESSFRTYKIPDSYSIVISKEDSRKSNLKYISIDGKSIDSFEQKDLIEIINRIYSNANNNIQIDETV